MLVRWNDIPEADRNGFILGYKVSISTTDLAVLSLLPFSCAILQRPDLKHCIPPHLISLSFFQFDPESLPADSTILEDSLVNIFSVFQLLRFHKMTLLLSPPHFSSFLRIHVMPYPYTGLSSYLQEQMPINNALLISTDELGKGDCLPLF